MAIITGTTGSDTIVGTGQADTINPLTGFFDTVDGAGGYDTLIVDYSAARPTVYSDVTLDSDLSGSIGFPLAYDSVYFSHIEALNVRLDSQANQFTFRALKPFNGQVVAIDGGWGNDIFKFDAPTFNSISFKVDALGKVTSNLGLQISNFENFQLYVGGGTNVITTGARSDIVSVGVGTSTISTGDQNDTIIVHGGHDTIDGGGDVDTLSIELGSSSAAYTLDHNRLKATASVTGMLSAKNIEIVNAVLGSGADTITMTEAWYATINSGGGADVFRFFRPDGISIDGGEGIDFASINLSGIYRNNISTLTSNGLGGFDGSFGGNSFRNMEKLYLTLSQSDDYITVDAAPLAKGAVVTMFGGEGYDSLTLDLSARNAVKLGFAADGSLKYWAGKFSGFENYTFIGTAGNDDFTGGATNFSAKAGAGNDILRGGSGNDILFGEGGNDKLYLSAGIDELHGGTGNDQYFIDGSYSLVALYEEANEGTDTVYASVDAFLAPNVEILRLTGTADILGIGSDDANTIVGNSGSNRLEGNGGRDNISGGDGIDYISGGTGGDTLTGGNGIDIFIFDTLETSAERDTITDFVSGVDHIRLDSRIFSAFPYVPFGTDLAATNFVLGTKAISADHHIIYNGATGSLYYDEDGAGGAAQIQIAILTNKPALQPDDLYII